MKKIKYIRTKTIVDKRFFPVLGKVYDVEEVRDGRPIIRKGPHTVWLHEGEYKEMIE